MTLENIGKRSLSRNNLLFGLMQRMDLVEKSGSGFLRIRRALRKYKMADPTIETDDHWFTLTFARPDLQKKSIRERLENDETTQKTVEKTVEKILVLIGENKNITQDEISKQTGLSRRGVEWNLKMLKEKGVIERIGPDKGGYWKIIKK